MVSKRIVDKIIEQFYRADKYKEGLIHRRKVEDAFEDAGAKLSPEQVQRLLKEIPEDHDKLYEYR
jgi:Ca2+-binding EF-hand superfamily protein